MNPNAAAQGRTLQIIWLAFVLAVFAYAAVPLLVFGDRGAAGAQLPAALPPVLWAVAGGLAVASFVVRGRIAGARVPPSAVAATADPFARLRTGCIITWALSETVAVLGLVLGMLGAPPPDYAPYVGAAVVLLYLHRPAVWPLDAAAPGGGATA